MILKKQTCVIAGLDIDENQYKSEHEIKKQETIDLLAVLFWISCNFLAQNVQQRLEKQTQKEKTLKEIIKARKK